MEEGIDDCMIDVEIDDQGNVLQEGREIREGLQEDISMFDESIAEKIVDSSSSLKDMMILSMKDWVESDTKKKKQEDKKDFKGFVETNSTSNKRKPAFHEMFSVSKPSMEGMYKRKEEETVDDGMDVDSVKETTEEEDTLRFDDTMEMYGLASDFSRPSIKHISSYDQFVFQDFKRIIKGHTIRMLSKATDRIHIFKFGEPFFSFPRVMEKSIDAKSSDFHSGMNTITNHVECERRGLSYVAAVFIGSSKHVVQKFSTKEIVDVKTVENLYLGELPIMVHSQLCTMLSGFNHPSEKREDPCNIGGYFVIEGTRKIAVGIHSLAWGDIMYQYKPGANKRQYFAEIRSRNWNPVRTPTRFSIFYTESVKNSLHELNVNMTFLSSEIPLAVLMLALGAKGKDHIYELLLGTKDIFKDDSIHHIKRSIVTDMLLHPEVRSIIVASESSSSMFPNNTGSGSVSDQQKYGQNVLGSYLNALPKLQREAMIYIGCRPMSSVDQLDDKTDEEKEGIVEKRIYFANEFLTNTLLPHMGTSMSKPTCNFSEKLYLIAMIVRGLLDVITGKRPPDNRERQCNRMIRMDGDYLRTLGVVFMKKTIKEAIHRLRDFVDHNEYADLDMLHMIPFKHCKLTIAQFLLNGIIPTMSNGKTGLTNTFFEFNHACRVSNACKLDTMVMRESKEIQAREVSLNATGFLCLIETPEGANVGLHGFPTVLSITTTGSSPFYLFDVIEEYSMQISEIEDVQILFGHTKVILDGMWKWITANPDGLYQRLFNMKRHGEMFWQNTIYYDRYNNYIHVKCSEGRIIIPVFVVETDSATGRQYLPVTKDVKEMATKRNPYHPFMAGWEWLLMKGDVMYVGPDELQDECNSMARYPFDLNKPVGINKIIPKYRFCMIHPSSVLSFAGCLIPMVGTSPTSRNSFASGMDKQSMSMPSQLPHSLINKTCSMLWYAQRPLTMTKNRAVVDGFKDDGMIAINLFTVVSTNPETIEDSIVLNRSVIDRGACRVTFYREDKESYPISIASNGLRTEDGVSFGKPDINSTTGMKNEDYSILEEDGLPYIGARVNPRPHVSFKSDYIVVDGVPVDRLTGERLNIGPTVCPEISLQGKHTVIFGKVESKIDISTGLRTTKDLSKPYPKGEGIVSNVMITEGSDDHVTAKVTLCMTKRPTVGDKFCLPASVNVFTLEHGWISIKDASETRTKIHILTRNRFGRSAFMPVLEWHRFILDGKLCEEEDVNDISKVSAETLRNSLVQIKNENVSLLCTNEHKLFTSKGTMFDAPELIRVSDYISSSSLYTNIFYMSSFTSNSFMPCPLPYTVNPSKGVTNLKYYFQTVMKQANAAGVGTSMCSTGTPQFSIDMILCECVFLFLLAIVLDVPIRDNKEQPVGRFPFEFENYWILPDVLLWGERISKTYANNYSMFVGRYGRQCCPLGQNKRRVVPTNSSGYLFIRKVHNPPVVAPEMRNLGGKRLTVFSKVSPSPMDWMMDIVKNWWLAFWKKQHVTLKNSSSGFLSDFVYMIVSSREKSKPIWRSVISRFLHSLNTVFDKSDLLPYTLKVTKPQCHPDRDKNKLIMVITTSDGMTIDVIKTLFSLFTDEYSLSFEKRKGETVSIHISKWYGNRRYTTSTENREYTSNGYQVDCRNDISILKTNKGKTIEVFCPTVSSGVFLIEHEGKFQWTGNSSMHSQKCTVSKIKNAEDMPYVPALGMIADAVFNPHGFPSRSTVGHLTEMSLGMLAAKIGKIGDGTSFEFFCNDDLYIALEDQGMEKFSRYVVHDGTTGAAYKEPCYCGFVSYMVLKHMVDLKVHARSTGPVNSVTGQPIPGRREKGGIKYGEMEMKCADAWGVSSFQQSTHQLSDARPFWLCDDCCVIAYFDESVGVPKCSGCNGQTFHKVILPGANNALQKYLQAMNIQMYFYATDEQIKREKDRKRKLKEDAMRYAKRKL